MFTWWWPHAVETDSLIQLLWKLYCLLCDGCLLTYCDLYLLVPIPYCWTYGTAVIVGAARRDKELLPGVQESDVSISNSDSQNELTSNDSDTQYAQSRRHGFGDDTWFRELNATDKRSYTTLPRSMLEPHCCMTYHWVLFVIWLLSTGPEDHAIWILGSLRVRPHKQCFVRNTIEWRNGITTKSSSYMRGHSQKKWCVWARPRISDETGSSVCDSSRRHFQHLWNLFVYSMKIKLSILNYPAF
jgi:hypothetical protein